MDKLPPSTIVSSPPRASPTGQAPQPAALRPGGPIRLLEIIGNAIVGGMETYVLRLLQRLPPSRFEITCFCPCENRFTEELRRAGCRVHAVLLPEEPIWRSIEFGIGVIRAEGIDVIHSHLTNANLLAGVLSQMTETPALATIHGRDLNLSDLEIQRLANLHLHVVSATTYYQALNVGVPAEQLRFIGNGVDGTEFRPGRASRALHDALDLPPATPLVGFVGRLSPEKGPEVFVRAATLAHAALPDVHFVLVGDGPMRERLGAIAAAGGAAERIHFAGVRADMPEVYNELTLLALTSYSEGMPLALMEAQASGLPVVATQVGGVPDVVVADLTGVLVPPGHPEAVANNLVALMGDPPRRQAMADAARRRMNESFRLQDRVDEMIHLFSSLAGRPSVALAAARA